MSEIRLIATDLDGTLLGEASGLDVFNGFKSYIDALRERHRAIWVISTGRSKESFRKVFHPLQLMGLQPDYVILKHAYIYGVSRFGFFPHRMWNLWVRYRVWVDRLNVQREINRWHQLTRVDRGGMHTVEKKATRLCLRFDSQEAADSAAELLEREARGYRHLRVFRYLREVDVRRVPFTKGMAVSELADHLGLKPENVLAIGDGHNDVSMFDPDVARMCGCPANAAPEIIKLVSESRGHIASAPCLGGVMEVLRAYQEGTVCSRMPLTWQDPAGMANPLPAKSPAEKRLHKKKRRPVLRIILWAMMVYVALAAFAEFGIVPGSGLIMWPYRVLEGAIARLFAWTWNIF
jgi:HAD superfamily hydrolase (TIGR01484 family)